MIKAIKMPDDLVVFVKVPERLKDSSVKRYEYSYGSNGKRVRVVTHGGTVLILDVHAVLRERKVYFVDQ